MELSFSRCAKTPNSCATRFLENSSKSQTRPWLTGCLNEGKQKALQLSIQRNPLIDKFFSKTSMEQTLEHLPHRPLRSQWNAKEQWRLLFTIHDKLIRDAAFIILCPSLLDNSQELPMVNHSILACNGDNWHATIGWLRALDPNEVSTWFAGRKRNSRLGDHFADCVEFVLRFAPAFRPSRLEISKQVHYNVPLQVVTETREETATQQSLEWDADQMPSLNNSHTGSEGTSRTAGRGQGGGAEEGGVGSAAEEVGRGGANGRRQSRRERKKFWRESHNRSAVTTVGEFDVLFTLKPDEDSAKEEIHHWELTTKFLLYIGPSQVLGVHAVQEAEAEESKLQEEGEVLAWYLGPHCGESLRSRKDRLCRQLRLSQTELGGGVVRQLYGEVAQGAAAGGLPPVVPSAFVAGYLFYNFPLWREMSARGFTFLQADESGAEAVPPGSASSAASRVNPYHWTGWWTNDLQELVNHPEACESRWYIIPKLEWLSPVLVLGSDEEGLRRVLMGRDVLEVSKKMGEEGRAMNLPKKLRFLVAEVQWIEDLEIFSGGVGDRMEENNEECHSLHEIGRNGCTCCKGDESVRSLTISESVGGWVEVSRGCLVEDTWPQLIDAKAHGLAPSQTSISQKD